ncbi:hypothetical protein [Nocardiopsis metallicus]|uniref:Uncharacterized protein n=1 Tax=Nocardiopsis metallicus TaxID=179819 RepID=A0A840WR60_9ACTN|nr:hypothetical protein [Nocardiopsis metallicus]MBB5494067.1 hypothetical protein [Nocardiopsis metallicus]
MRSPLVPPALGALTVVLVAAAALVWAVFLRAPDPGPASEVVVGESTDDATAGPTDDGLVEPPPPVTDRGGAGSPSAEPSPEPEPAPRGFPFDCLDENVNHEAWGEDEWDDWWDDCLDARYENGDDDDD